ncbi:MAG: hypothetical protein WEB87_04605 [Bacteriovoracaceae bacterium]
MNALKDEWIFYLKLTPNLSENFFSIDKEFKRYGLNLLPVSFPNLLELIKADETFHVVVLVTSQKEAAYYLRHVSKHAKNLLRFKKINMYAASSFAFINESSKLTFRHNYDFYPLPIKAADLCDKITTKVLDKAVENTKWPGGRTPRTTISR